MCILKIDPYWKMHFWDKELGERMLYPAVEREIKNMVINFGPQHPAAHGVLRLILELEGEVYSVLFH